jgi:hypothetical protein
MSRFTRLISVTALAGLALAGAASTATARANPEQNNPHFYEAGGTYECTKVELADGVTEYTAPWDVAFVVIKAGQTYVTLQPGESITLTQDISFIITCVGEDGGYEEPEPPIS